MALASPESKSRLYRYSVRLCRFRRRSCTHQDEPHRSKEKNRRMQIKDKRAIVTGGASGLGLAFSKELLRNGAATVVIFDIQDAVAHDAVENLNAEFGRNRALFLHCDVTNNSEFDAAFKEAIGAIGGLDILVNNAGIVNETNYAKAIDVNVTAVIRGTLLGIQQMRKDSGGKGGVIVNISSVAGLCAFAEVPIYSATKHAVVSFSRSFAQPYHYQRTGVRIIIICPGATQTSGMDEYSMDQRETETLNKHRPQKVECVAHGLVYAIRCARNGTVWVSEDGKPVYEVQLSDTLPQKVMDDTHYQTESD